MALKGIQISNSRISVIAINVDIYVMINFGRCADVQVLIEWSISTIYIIYNAQGLPIRRKRSQIIFTTRIAKYLLYPITNWVEEKKESHWIKTLLNEFSRRDYGIF